MDKLFTTLALKQVLSWCQRKFTKGRWRLREPRLYVATLNEILSGEITDIYFDRTKRVIEKSGLSDIKVRMEAHVYSLPEDYEWAIYAGLEEALAVLKGKPVDVYSLPEGTIFKAKEPLMMIEGRYIDFGVFETALLGILRFASSIATKTARIKVAAGGKTILYFGLRALHPAVAPAADRAAYIGGADSISGLFSDKYIGVKPSGTMPHALIIVFGNQVKAWKAFYEVVGNETPLVTLVDTFCDEREEALLAAKTFGEKLFGVRLDTPSSRRGKMKEIVEEVRWTLNLHGYKNVKIIVSGGLNEKKIAELRDVADGFGVGTSISVAPSIDISMDIVEIEKNGEWVPLTKRGKLPGAKKVYRCKDLHDYVTYWNEEPPMCPDGSKPKPLMTKFIENGTLIKKLPSIEDIRSYVVNQLRELKLL